MITPLPATFVDPPRDYSLAPFWFWNDDLDADELRRQIDDFHDHGVYAFVIHPRVGLPRSLPFMGDALLSFMRVAVEHAATRGMWVILYDEGMYPSGAAAGRVVAEDPAYACRGLIKQPLINGRTPTLGDNQHLVTTGQDTDGRFAIIDLPINSWVRGLHYEDHNAPRAADRGRRFEPGAPMSPPIVPETRPPAADLLNPDAMAAFVRIVYDGYAAALGEHFGSTIRAIFTDEPMVLGRGGTSGAKPGSAATLPHVNKWFGRDVTRELPLLWKDTPEAQRFANDYDRAIKARLEQTYYQPLHDWCQVHGLNLTGHPHHPDDLGIERYFHWPGQDVIWHEVRPGESALHGRPSTQAKVAASAKAHDHRTRNANEYMGAYGHSVNWTQLRWVTDWLLIRGCDLLIPHAFFYSIRGPRINECPPQLGPHGKFWDGFKHYADACRRLCYLNATGRPVVKTAVLALSDCCPHQSPAAMFKSQIDFHYLDHAQLINAEVDDHGVRLAGFHYQALVIEQLPKALDDCPRLRKLATLGRLIVWQPGMWSEAWPHAVHVRTPGDIS